MFQNKNSLNNLIIGDNGGKNMQAPVIWFTGLPASGKTTLANELKKYYDQRSLPCDILDGDKIRETLSKDLGFSPDDRKEHNRRAIFVAKLLAKNGVTTIIPLISPYRETRDTARKEIPNFFEVWVKAMINLSISIKQIHTNSFHGEKKK